MTRSVPARDAGDQPVRGSRLSLLFRQHAPHAMQLAYLMTGDRELAEDLVQDAFVRLFGRWQDLRNPDAFAAYLRRTVINLARNHLRRQKLHRLHVEREQRAGATPDVELPDLEGRDELVQALARLPYRQRAVIVLRHFEDLSEQQTADALDCSVSAVKSAASRGIAALKKDLGGARDD